MAINWNAKAIANSSRDQALATVPRISILQGPKTDVESHGFTHHQKTIIVDVAEPSGDGDGGADRRRLVAFTGVSVACRIGPFHSQWITSVEGLMGHGCRAWTWLSATMTHLSTHCRAGAQVCSFLCTRTPCLYLAEMYFTSYHMFGLSTMCECKDG